MEHLVYQDCTTSPSRSDPFYQWRPWQIDHTETEEVSSRSLGALECNTFCTTWKSCMYLTWLWWCNGDIGKSHFGCHHCRCIGPVMGPYTSVLPGTLISSSFTLAVSHVVSLTRISRSGAIVSKVCLVSWRHRELRALAGSPAILNIKCSCAVPFFPLQYHVGTDLCTNLFFCAWMLLVVILRLNCIRAKFTF